MHTQNRPFSKKNFKKIFLPLKIALKTQKSRPSTEGRHFFISLSRQEAMRLAPTYMRE